MGTASRWRAARTHRRRTPEGRVRGPSSGDVEKRTDRLARRWQAAHPVLLALLGAGVVCAVLYRSVNSDITLYHGYAKAALAAPLFHSLPKEYPALSLAVFLVPELFAFGYPVVFALLAAAAGVALVLASDGLERYPGWSRRTAVYLLCGTLAVIFDRYDIFPAAAALLAVEGARRGRWGRAWAWAVLGGLLKLFPFLLLPGFLVVERARTGKWALHRALVACAPVSAVLVAQLLLAPGSVLSPVRYELRRGFELSSLQGSVAFLTSPLHATWVRDFGAVEIVSHGHAVIGLLVSVASILALVALWVLASRGRLSVEAVSLACLSVAVLADKAFAAQYLIWLVPLWAYWPLRRGWVAAALLTTAVYPFLYEEARSWGPSFYLATAGGLVRNAVLIVATAGWLIGQLKLREQVGDQGKSGADGGPSARRGPVLSSEGPVL